MKSGHWLLYRYNPALAIRGRIRCSLTPRSRRSRSTSMRTPRTGIRAFKSQNPTAAAKMMGEAQAEVTSHWNFYKQLVAMDYTITKK